MTTEPQDDAAPSRDGALATLPVTLLIQVGEGHPHIIGRDTISVPGTLDPDGAGITFDAGQADKATVQAVNRIITRNMIGHGEEDPA